MSFELTRKEFELLFLLLSFVFFNSLSFFFFLNLTELLLFFFSFFNFFQFFFFSLRFAFCSFTKGVINVSEARAGPG